MDNEKALRRIDEIEEQLADLPRGYVVYKMIHGKRQPYLQWNENGKPKSRYIKAEYRDDVIADAALRKELTEELKSLRSSLPSSERNEAFPVYRTEVVLGGRLRAQSLRAAGYGKRNCFRLLERFMESALPGRVCVLYGPRGTGKTTMMLQAANGLSEEDLERAAYIRIRSGDTSKDLEADIDRLWKRGYLFIFIDGATLMDDFIESSSILSDIYAMMGMKIVLSGEDSFSFRLALRQELYDRAYTVRTTYIPFSEHSRLTGLDSFEGYIRSGGTLVPGDDPETTAFSDREAADRYADSAVCENIERSLRRSGRSEEARRFRDICEAGTLKRAVKRVIRRLDLLFMITLLGSCGDWNGRDHIAERLSGMLRDMERSDAETGITEARVGDITDWLKDLDIIAERPERNMTGARGKQYIFTQPALRYAQVKKLADGLLETGEFRIMSAWEREYISGRIMEEAAEQMMKDAVLLETARSLPKDRHAFRFALQGAAFDMVIYTSGENTCELYEINHSREIVLDGYHVLEDEEQTKATERQYGKITRRCVIYLGKSSTPENGIEYLNVEEYLKSL